MKWISVEENYPEKALNVLVSLKDGRRIGIAIGYWLANEWWGGIKKDQKIPHIDGVENTYDVPDIPGRCVTHWMYLPEFPYEMDRD